MSVDVHKYGCSPKGVSVVCYARKEFVHYQYCVVTDFPGVSCEHGACVLTFT